MCVYLFQLEGKTFEVRPLVSYLASVLAYCLEYNGPCKQVLATMLDLTFNLLISSEM